ncbi:MAG TPA: hypothetical protein VIM81_12155, partial [Gammaproteobacteria bacterium]
MVTTRRRKNRERSSLLPGIALAVLAGCEAPPPAGPQTAATFAAVDGARIVAADTEPGNWLTHGRTYAEQRFSP